MTKAIAIILLILAIGGGIYFTKKDSKSTASEGNPISTTVSTSTKSAPFFDGNVYGPAVRPVSYVVTKKGGEVPKIKINCLNNQGIYAFEKSAVDTSGIYTNVCGKFVSMNDPKYKTYEGDNLYNFFVYFVNETQATSTTVSAEAKFDGKTIKINKDVLILPTNSSISEIPKG